GPVNHRDPWSRLAVYKSTQIREKLKTTKSAQQLTKENLWRGLALADPDQPIFLPSFLAEQGFNDIDLIKIDVDGPDFDILDSLKNELTATKVIAVVMEVNWFGSAHPSDHTFHNTDRFLRSLGFELFNLSVRRYSHAALPQRYELRHPAQGLR